MTEMRISSFGSQEDGYVELDEPLVFRWEQDPKTGYFVIRGTGDYGHVMTYGDTLSEATRVLRRSVLPVMWEYERDASDG